METNIEKPPGAPPAPVPVRSTRSTEITSAVQMCGPRAIEIGGLSLMPDSSKAYIEFRLSHGFPVVTTDSTCMHPNVVANSYKTMLHQVFNLGHIMRAYDPKEYYRDRILGSVVAVEFPPTPMGGWRVQGKRQGAPGIRAVAVMHKDAEGVDKIIGQHQSGRRKWTVSLESVFYVNECGFLVAGRLASPLGLVAEQGVTPADFRELGYIYVPMEQASEELLSCYDSAASKIIGKYRGCEVMLMIGGLNGTIHYKGVGMTPLGKEPAAEVQQILASGVALVDEEEGTSDLTPGLQSLVTALRNSLLIANYTQLGQQEVIKSGEV